MSNLITPLYSGAGQVTWVKVTLQHAQARAGAGRTDEVGPDLVQHGLQVVLRQLQAHLLIH